MVIAPDRNVQLVKVDERKRATLSVTAQVVEFDSGIQLFVPTELELAQHRFRRFQALLAS